jgi:hypothetical protein
MRLQAWIAALLFSTSCAAFAQTEQPEQVYQKLHRATLAANADEMMNYATAAKRQELKNMPGRDAAVKMIATLMPKQYVVNSRVFNPDGKTARLIASGMGEFMGQHSMMYGTINFIREDGKWLVDQWEWGNQKPAAFPVAAPVPAPKAAVAAAAPAVPAAAAVTPAEQAASAPKEMSKLERQAARKKASEEAEAKRLAMSKEKDEADRKASEARWKDCVIKPVMSDDELRKCGATIKSN